MGGITQGLVMNIEELHSVALKLEPAAKLKLIRELVLSLDALSSEALEAVWLEEVAQRLQEVEEGRVKLIPGDEVFARIRSRLA